MIGEMLGPYRLLEQIGAGGMATVFKAYDAAFDRHVAIKLLPAQYYSDARFRQRFAREARAIARLEHLHILPVYAYGEDRGHMYLAMRLMTSGSLAEYLQLTAPLPLAEAARLIRQIGSALDYAHQRGVLHRDVKPGNVLLDENRNAYLTDFGIARVVEDASLTATGAIVGTPAYMAPEQCMGREDLGPAADQYALGIITYQMLTGRLPFVAETPMAVVLKQMHDPLPLPRQFRPEIPDSVQRVLLKALAKAPDHRFATCTALADALEEAIAHPEFVDAEALLPAEAEALVTPTGETVGAIPQAGPTRVTARRRGWLWMALLPGLIAVALIAGWIARGGRVGAATPSLAPTEALIAAAPVETATATARPSPTLTATASALPPTATLTPSPTATGGRDWIAYVTNNNYSLGIARLDGSEAHTVAEAEGITSPRWSPDGRYLAAYYRGVANSAPGQDIGVLLVNLETGESWQYEARSMWPGIIWSGDSSTLMFGCLLEQVMSFCVVDAASGEVRSGPVQTGWWGWLWGTLSYDGSRLLYACTNEQDGEVCLTYTENFNTLQLSNSINDDSYPVWSPDETQIAYLSAWDQLRPALTQQDTGLYLVNADGSGRRLIAPVPVDYSVYALGWSPDGRYLAYSGSYVSAFNPELIIVEVESGESWRVGGFHGSPQWSWSPVEALLLLELPVDGYPDLFTLVPGGVPVNLTNHIANDREAGWSPDGQMILFSSSRDNSLGLFLMNKDGRGLRPVPITGVTELRNFSWR